MHSRGNKLNVCLAFVFLIALAVTGLGEDLPAGIKTKAEAKIKALEALTKDPRVVSAVKEYNAAPPAKAKDMTNDKWKELTVLDPYVRSFTKTPLAEYLKSKKDDSVAEMFVSGADGGKVAFLSKTTSWSHKGKPKHEEPMSGKVYIGPIEMDDSTGAQEFQVGLPILDGETPIGSLVVGLKVASFR